MWGSVLAFLRSWGIITLLIAGGVAVAYRFVAPAPPSVVRIAVGPGDNAYTQVTDAYARGLEREGFHVERRATAGSVENLALLRAREVDLALVQGGVAGTTAPHVPGALNDTTRNEAREADLASLGAVFFEPAWVFVRRAPELTRALHLEGRRVAVGPEGSGTRALAFALLAANGVAAGRVTALPLTGGRAAAALLAGEVDAAIFVSATPGEGIGPLLRQPERAQLVDFAGRADAYAAVLPYLTPVRLPRSGFSLPDDLPDAEVTLMAPAASVVTHRDIHPQIVTLMLRIMHEVHRGRQLFSPEGRFPSALNGDLPLDPDAARYYQRGPTFLQSYLPFWVAVTVERLWVLLIPLITLAVPLIRFAPPLYTWQMESRVYRWYDDLRRIEADLPAADRGARKAMHERLDTLEQQVAAVTIPPSYGRHLFALRRDIEYVRERVAGG